MVASLLKLHSRKIWSRKRSLICGGRILSHFMLVFCTAQNMVVTFSDFLFCGGCEIRTHGPNYQPTV